MTTIVGLTSVGHWAYFLPTTNLPDRCAPLCLLPARHLAQLFEKIGIDPPA